MSAVFDPWPPLADYELPRALVTPALNLCRGFNTLLDQAFYDVDAFKRATDPGSFPSNDGPAGLAGADLTADANPEGSLLVIDAAGPTFVQRFATVDAFLGSDSPGLDAVRIASITGVGSSALGSAALAWDVSVAFGEPVLAIVPGYGVADALLQGLGGWFGYGLHDALKTKTFLQDALAVSAPSVAKVGRRLSAPYDGTLLDAPVFERGSGSADVLHAMLGKRKFACLVGHSKGALTIGNALGSPTAGELDDLLVITLGCPIARTCSQVRYKQFLGRFDLLGILNSWWHWPDDWIDTVHTTNTSLPLDMPVVELCRRFAPLSAPTQI